MDKLEILGFILIIKDQKPEITFWFSSSNLLWACRRNLLEKQFLTSNNLFNDNDIQERSKATPKSLMALFSVAD